MCILLQITIYDSPDVEKTTLRWEPNLSKDSLKYGKTSNQRQRESNLRPTPILTFEYCKKGKY
jgi:hypothetical protein